MLEIVEILDAVDSVVAKDQALGKIEVEILRMQKYLDEGLEPSDYDKTSLYLKALKTSITVLKNYSNHSLSEKEDRKKGGVSAGSIKDESLNWLVCQVGFLASLSGSVSDAVIIFEGLSVANEDNITIKQALGMTYTLAERNDEAISLYRESILTSELQNTAARAFLGIALWHKGEKHEARKHLIEASKYGDIHAKEVSGAFMASEAFVG